MVNLYSLSRVETKTRAYTAFARIKDKWFGKGSPSLKVALSMRKCIYAKTRAEEIEKKRERRDWAEGKRKTPSLLSPNCDRSKDETRRKIRQRKKKNARVTKQIDEIVHRSLNGEREKERENVVRSFVYLKHITFYPPFRPLDGKARVASCRRYFIIPGKEKTVHNCKVNRISLIKFLLSTNEPLVYTMPDWSTNKCNFQPLFGLPWEYARTF